ncbi:MAG: hypothetical protein GTN49_01160 [candidate division Zixibacteria bacterium]|nr:hypothetical protein [candidate division Zixibacteria bacterium]
MVKRTKAGLLKTLTAGDLKEICKRYEIKGYSGLSQAALAKHVAENLDLPQENVEQIVNEYVSDKIIEKIKDSADYFLNKRVKIKTVEGNVISADVGGYNVTIHNLGAEDFAYYCDDRCPDYTYQVKKGRYPFCKHFPAAVAELIYQERLPVERARINHISGGPLEELGKLVECRRHAECGAIEGRDIENTLAQLNRDYLAIARQDAAVARERYHEQPEYVFETLTAQAFELLEFDTIIQRKPTEWDLVIIAGRAGPPYIGIGECKTTAGAVYELKADYLVRLKSFCLDMFKNKVPATYADFVKYLVLVAPAFSPGSEGLAAKFRVNTGISMSLWPAETLLYWVNQYRKNPILIQRWAEPLFSKEAPATKADIDKAFRRAEVEIENLTVKLQAKLRDEFAKFSHTSADASFVTLDLVILESIIKAVIDGMAPQLVMLGKKGVTGVDTLEIKHDYYAPWGLVLGRLVDEFVDILKEISHVQVKNPAFKEELIKYLAVEQ